MKAARDYPILTVTAKGTRWLESGHPWVYARRSWTGRPAAAA